MCLCVHIFTCLSAHIHVHMEARFDFRCLIPQVSTFAFGCCFETGSFTDHGPSLLRFTGCCVSTYSVLAQQTRVAMCSFFHLWCGQYSVPFDYMRTALQAELSPLYFILCSRLGALRTLALASASPCLVHSALFLSFLPESLITLFGEYSLLCLSSSPLPLLLFFTNNSNSILSFFIFS